MKIAIDARLYGPRQGGIGRYIQQIISRLEKLDKDNDYVVFLRRENYDEYTPTAPNFRKIMADIPWYGWREQLILPLLIRKEKPDLVHFPHWNIPLLYRGKFIVTIHDLLLLHYPTRAASTLGPLGYFFKNIAYRLVLRHAARASRHILTVSEYSKTDIVKELKVPAEKITVTHLAPLPAFTAPSAPDILQKYRIAKPYALYVGAAFPHKNLTGLLDIWKIFQERYGEDFALVLAGRRNFFYEQLSAYAAGQKISNIIFTDFVPDGELPALYRHASLYVFPSLYEGFGLPPLEAIQYGIPVASSDRTCMPEVLGDAALYFDPENYRDAARVLVLCLKDNGLRTKLVQAGQKLIHNYSWEKAALTTLAAYQKVV